MGQRELEEPRMIKGIVRIKAIRLELKLRDLKKKVCFFTFFFASAKKYL